ncbi:MAG: hypothetical protein QOK42_1335, partial [Frankiaceae bacterium]|nr:hypothetical protein [Frankiaceae bacterium]
MTSPMTRGIAAALVASAVLASCGGSDKTAAPVIDPGPAASYHPNVAPARFVAAITNPYLPLRPGAKWVYDGTEHVEVLVTGAHKVIAGVNVVAVRDTVSEDGEVIEDTQDWYAQDVDGSVWYMGEATQELSHGRV